LKISIVTFGTLGEVRPSLALALGLKKKGHEVILCAPPENEELITDYRCTFKALGSNYKDYVIREANLVATPSNYKRFFEFHRQIVITQIEQLPEIIKGSDLVIGTGFLFGAPTVAEYLNIPYQHISFCPSMLGFTNKFFYKFLWWLLHMEKNYSYLKLLNQKRAEMKLQPIKYVYLNMIGSHPIVASDIPLMTVSENVKFKYFHTGSMLLKNKEEELDHELEMFLQSGKPPIYVGFGSMPLRDADKMAKLLVELAESLEQRFIISKGWAGLKKFGNQTNCIFVGHVPHVLLFSRVAAVIHHGGAGTLQQAARAGVPQIIIPVMGDQFDWRKQVVKLGLGPHTKKITNISAKALEKAIKECISNGSYKKRAEEFSKIISKIDGVELTIKVIEENLNKAGVT
jgi:vancomycin aglycone glucosyltransferase